MYLYTHPQGFTWQVANTVAFEAHFPLQLAWGTGPQFPLAGPRCRDRTVETATSPPWAKPPGPNDLGSGEYKHNQKKTLSPSCPEHSAAAEYGCFFSSFLAFLFLESR